VFYGELYLCLPILGATIAELPFLNLPRAYG
jgi:hypothetical protein